LVSFSDELVKYSTESKGMAEWRYLDGCPEALTELIDLLQAFQEICRGLKATGQSIRKIRDVITCSRKRRIKDTAAYFHRTSLEATLLAAKAAIKHLRQAESRISSVLFSNTATYKKGHSTVACVVIVDIDEMTLDELVVVYEIASHCSSFADDFSDLYVVAKFEGALAPNLCFKVYADLAAINLPSAIPVPTTEFGTHNFSEIQAFHLENIWPFVEAVILSVVVMDGLKVVRDILINRTFPTLFPQGIS
jgi:hypothetical protein